MRSLFLVLGLEPFEQAPYSLQGHTTILLKLRRPHPTEQHGLQGSSHVHVGPKVCAEVPYRDQSACVRCVMFMLSATSSADRKKITTLTLSLLTDMHV